ncbi:MAG: glycosyltransferase family 4 protein [Rhodothermales bacterium]
MARTLFVDHAGVLGGAELYLLDVVRHMRHNSRVVLFEDGPFMDRLKSEAIPTSILQGSDAVMGVERAGGKLQDLKAMPGIFQMVMRLRKLAKKFDVVYANSQKALIIGALAGKAAMRPVIWNLHDILTADHFSASHRKIAVMIANRFVDHVIVNSEATREAFGACGGNLDKTSIVYNGIDAKLFQSVDANEVRDLRDSLGLKDEMVVGLFSRLTEWKGQHVLLEAIAQLKDVHVVLVGGALFQDDASYEQKLRGMVHDLNIADRVHFLGFRDDVPRLMKSVDIVAHCSTSPEPFGRVIVEGMLAKKPVIAANAGGAREIVTQNETGLLVEPSNPKALAEAILRLKEHPDKAQEMAEAGFTDAYRRFAIENIVKQIENQIRKVIGGPNAVAITETSASPV